ncbi:MAG: hypothetical protein ACOCXS_01950, partial [Bacteroidota bacterium]
ESGAAAETVNHNGLSLLGIATANGDMEMVDLIMAYMNERTNKEDKRKSAMALALFGRNKPLAGKLKANEFIKPRGLYFSELQVSQGFDFNGDDNFYHSSISLFEARYQLQLRLQYLVRVGYRKLLVPRGNASYYQFFEKRNVLSLGLYREFVLWRFPDNKRLGLAPGLDMAWSSAHYRGTGLDAPKGFEVIPAAELFLHFGNMTFFGGFDYFDTGHDAISPYRYRLGMAYRIQLYQTKPLKYTPILN